MSELKHKRLWFEYWQDRNSTEAKARLMEVWMPLVHAILTRVAIRLPSHVSREDLLQSALIGLHGSIERFKPDVEASFETFACRRIQGAILDELRGSDYISRGARARVRKVEEAIEEGIRKNGVPPTEEELAELAGMSQRALASTLDSARPWLSLDQAVMSNDPDNSVLLRDVLVDVNAEQPANEVEQEDMRRFLREAFRNLTVREQKILYLYYFEELRLKEIAALFEVTEARVCQIHTVATMKLKASMKLYGYESYRAAS
jgi:RNA polymerase sigma factor FliA